jgi:hypothetical protein
MNRSTGKLYKQINIRIAQTHVANLSGNNKNNRATTEDPYIEFLQSKLKQSEQKHEQRTLSTFVL